MSSNREKKDKVLSLRDNERGENKKGGGQPVKSQVSWGLLFILVIVIFSFVIWPVVQSAAESGGSANIFGYYRTEPIIYTQGVGIFSENVERYTANMDDRARNIGELDQELGQSILLMELRDRWRQAYYETLTTFARRAQVRDNGYRYNQDTIDENLIRQFFTSNGVNVDYTALDEIDNRQRRNLTEKVEFGLYTNQYFADLGDALYFSSAERELLQTPPGETRTINYLYLTASDYPDEEVSGYAAANPALFKRIKLSRIRAATQQEVDQAMAEWRQGDILFSELIDKYSDDPVYEDSSGSVSWIYRYEFASQLGIDNDEIADAIFALNQGEVAPPITVSDYFYLYHCDEEAEDIDIENQLTTVRSYIENNNQGIITDYLSSRLDEIIAAAASTPADGEPAADDENAGSVGGLNAAAQTYQVELKQSGPIFINLTSDDGSNYGYVQNLYTRGPAAFGESEIEQQIAASILNNESFYRAVWELAPGDIADPIPLDNGRILLTAELIESSEPDAADFGNDDEDSFSARIHSNSRFYTTFGNDLSFFSSEDLNDRFDVAFERYIQG